MEGIVAAVRNRGLVALMLGHFTVDSYAGLLPVFFPLLINRFQINLGTVALVTLAYSGMAAISQPLFGAIADRWGTRYTGLALLWTASTFAAIGFVPTFPLLVALAATSGLGSGAFHPQGALTVRRLLPARGRNVAMSVYVTGGTLGLATGPLIGVVVFGLLGSRGTAVMLLPGLAIAAFLILFKRSRPGLQRPHRAAPRFAAAIPLAALVATVVVMGSRTWTMTSLQLFTPTWYHQLGYQPWFYGLLATTLVLASAFGTVGVGSIADRYGRRAVIIGSLLVSLPAVFLFVAFPGPLGFVWAILVGLSAASTAPLILLIAQELMQGRAGLASGLIMGLGFVSGAVGAPIIGFIADRVGLQLALGVQLLVVLVTIPVALLLPTERALAARHRTTEAPAVVATGGR